MWVQTLSRGAGGLPGPIDPRDIVATSDGEHAYLATTDAGGITHLVRSGGALRFGEVVSAPAVPQPVAVALDEALQVVYAGDGNGVVAFARDDAGRLTAAGSVAVPTVALAAAAGRLVSVRDGRLAVLSGGPAPALQFERQSEHLVGARAVRLSADGQRIFVAAAAANTVSAWSAVDSEAQAEVVSNQPGTRGANALAITADRIYVAGFCDHDVAILQREPLMWLGSLYPSSPAAPGCTSLQGGQDDMRLEHPTALAIAPDGRLAVAARALSPEVGLLDLSGDQLSGVSFIFEQPDYYDHSSQPFYLAPGSGNPRYHSHPEEFRDTAALFAAGPYLLAATRLNNSVAVIEDGHTVQFVQRGDGGTGGGPGSYNLALSPDDRHVYVAPRIHGVPTVYGLNAETGALIELPSPTRPGHLQLDGGLSNVTLSPDGKQVLTLDSADDGTLVVWDRDVDSGQLSFSAEYPIPRCANGVPVPVDVMVLPQGDFVLIADYQQEGPSCLHVWRRAPDTSLSPHQIFKDEFLAGVESFLVTADASRLYTCAVLSGSLGQFNVTPDGLSAVAPFSHPSLEGAEFCVLSPDEHTMYVSSPVLQRLVVLDRSPSTGQLSHRQTITESDAPVQGAAGLAVTPDGSRVFMGTRLDEALLAFDVQPNGHLALRTALRDLDGLRWVNGVEMTGNGRVLVTAAVASSAVSTFQILAPNADGCGGTCP